jgi:hypothetical protein
MKLVLQGTVVVAVLALLLFAAPSAYANNCASAISGNWSAPATWSSCGSGIPTAADNVKVTSSLTVTVDVSNAVAASMMVGATPGSGTATLLFNSGSQLTVAGVVTLGGANTTTNGTISMTSGGKLSAGSLAVGAGVNTKTWTPGTGTVELTATNTIPATVFTSFNNLTINGATTTTTLGAALAVTGNLIITTGTLSANNLNLNVGGNWTNNASTTAFTAGTSTVTFNSAAAQAIGGTFATTFGNLTLANTASTVTLGANAGIAGNLSVSSATFDLASFTADRVTSGGTLTVANNATLKIGGTNTFPTNYTTNTLVVASTVEYSGTNQTVANETYGNLKLSSSSGAAVKTFPGTALTVVGNLSSVLGTGTSVSFTAAAIITVNGNISLGASTTFNGGSYAHSVGGNWVNSGTFNGNTGTITFTGAGAAISGGGTQNFNNLTVAASAATFSSGSITLTGSLATTGSGSVTQAPGGTLSMTGSGTTISGSGISLANLSVSAAVGAATSFNLAGNLTVSGSLNASSGTITMSGAAKTISGTGTKVFAVLSVTGSITTDANFSISSGLTISGSLSASAGAATFTGTSTLSGTASLFNTTINGTSLQLSANSTLGIAGVLTITAGTLNVTSSAPSTVNFNGTGAQSINGISYDSLILSNGNIKTANAGITVNHDFTIATGTTFVGGAFTHSVSNDWNNSGTFTAGTGTIQFLGNHTTNINGATTFNILTLNSSTAATGVVLQSDITAATVNMTLGTMLTGTHRVTITVTRTGNGHIIGNIQRTHSFTTGVAYAFETPNNTITFSSVSGVTSITVSIIDGSVSDFPFTSSVNEESVVTIPAGTYNATLRLDYEEDELNGNTESTMTLWRYNGSAWVNSGKTGNDATLNYVEQSGLTSITNRWTFADSTGPNVVRWNGSISTDWNTVANWTVLQGSASRPPSTADIAELGTAAFTYQPTISNTVSVKALNFGSVQAVTLSMSAGGSLTATNISGTWGGSVTHTLNVNNQSITVDDDMSLSDGVNGHVINLNIGSGTVNIGDAFTQSGGANIVFSAAGTLNIGGNYDHISGTFTRGTGTVIYNGEANQEVGAVSYYNLTINKTGGLAAITNAVNVLGNLLVASGELDNYSTTAISGNVTLNSGSTFVNNNEIHVGGNWSNSGTYVAEGLGIFFDGSGTQNISTSTFGNLNINKPSGTAILNGDLIINGNLIVTSGTLDFQTYFITRNTIGGFASIADGATGIIGGNNGPSGFATHTLGAASTVIYNGAGPQYVSTEGISFGNLIFRNAGTKTLITPLTANGNLTIDSGATLDASSYVITLNGNWINNGAFVPSASTLLANGASKSISGDTTFNRVTVLGSYTALSDISFNGLLNVTSTGSLSSGTSIHSTFNGDFTNSGVVNAVGTTTFSGNVVQHFSLINAATTVALRVVFDGTVAPVVNSTAAPQFGYITINNTAGISPTVGWTVLFGLTIGSGASFNAGASTHNLMGDVTNNGAMTSNGILNFLPSIARTVNLGSVFSSTGTVALGGAGAMTLAGAPSSFNNLLISNTNAAGVTPSSDWNVTNSFTVNNGSILNAGNHSYSVGGNLSNSGTINGGTSTFALNGSGTQDVYSGSAFNNLTINKTSGSTTLSANATVNGVLNFVAGKIQTGGNVLIQPSSGAITGAAQNTGWVNGQLQENIATATTSKTFEVGGPNNYTPVTVAFTGVTTAGDLTASAVSGDHGSIGTSTINPTKSVNRNWTLTNNGIVFSTYDATFNFVAGDVDAGASTSAFSVGKYNGSSWTYPTVGTKTSTSTQATGLTSFSDFQIGEVGFGISGHIQNAGSVAISLVTVTLSGGQSGTTMTDTSGNYSFAALLAGLNYTVTPGKTNYAFSPANLTYNNLSAAQTGADFTGTDYSGHAPSLGAAANFAVLAATTVTNTGLTVVSGNLGVSSGTAVTGFGPGVIQNGAIYSGGGSLAGPAQASAHTAYTDLVGQGCLAANNLSGKTLGVTPGAITLGPGVYCFGAAAQLTTTLTLDDGGDPGALFIFQIGTTLITDANSQVVMSGASRGANVFWQIGSSATIGAGTILRGNLIAYTSITMTTGASTTGRLLAIGAAVTMDTNAVSAVPLPASAPNVTLTASVNPTGIVQPHTDLVYTINFSNGGGGLAYAFAITDPIPANTDFKLGSMTTSLGTTGLTPTLAYSNDHGVSWTYTPVSAGGGAPAGYDRTVTDVRWSFGASLGQTLPDNAGSVSLTTRVR